MAYELKVQHRAAARPVMVVSSGGAAMGGHDGQDLARSGPESPREPPTRNAVVHLTA